jgi:hypothetical protein
MQMALKSIDVVWMLMTMVVRIKEDRKFQLLFGCIKDQSVNPQELEDCKVLYKYENEFSQQYIYMY